MTEHPFGLSFANARGATVLRETPPAAHGALALPIPGPTLGGSAAQQPALYAPLTFTIGNELLEAYTSGPWEGDLITNAETGIQYAARDVVAVRRQGRAVELTVSTSDPTGRRLLVTLSPEGRAIDVSVRPTPSTGVAALADSFLSGPGEAFHGFGGRHNALDQHGNSFYSWSEEENTDSGPFQPGANAVPGSGGSQYLFPDGPAAAYYPQPLFLSSHHYGFLVDQPDFTRFRLDSDRPDAWQASVASGALHYVVAPGGYSSAIRTLTAITGRQRVPPPWGLGPMLDRLVSAGASAPYDQLVEQDLRAIDRYRLPLRAYRVEGWDTIPTTTDRRLFAALKARHIHPLVYFRAYVGKHATTTHGGESLDYAVEHGYVATHASGAPYLFADPEGGVAALIDFTNPAAVDWWRGRIDAALDLGADGFMQDFGEQTLPDMHFHDGETGVEMHNRYPVLYSRATRSAFDAYQRRHRHRTLFFFTRAGYTGRPGSAAYENANFPGDETTDWTHSSGLASIVPDMLNRAVGGAYGYGTDIGGYLDTVTPRTTKELFLRWAEAAALTPVFRLHGSAEAGTHTPWSYDPQTVAIYERLSRLHVAAVPLLLRLWRQAARTGIPPTRPLWLAYPNDRLAAEQDEEWLLGPNLLVAPVVTAGVRSRSVYLPRGCWQEHGEGRRLGGRRRLSMRAPLTDLPFFVRCGTRPLGTSSRNRRRR